MELNAGTMDSGAAWGDRNGYTLTFDGMEAFPFALVADYTADPFDNTAFTFWYNRNILISSFHIFLRGE